jgi:hypothetical protein
MLLPSVPLTHVEIKVAKGGHAVTLKVRWPNNLLEPELMNSTFKDPDGRPSYLPWHPKNVAGKKAVRELRNYSTEEVHSSQDFLVPFKCEEHFTNAEGRPGLKFLRYKNGEMYAIVELMGVRDNYEDAKKARKYEFSEVEEDEEDESSGDESMAEPLPTRRVGTRTSTAAAATNVTAATHAPTAAGGVPTAAHVPANVHVPAAAAARGPTTICAQEELYDPGAIVVSHKRRAGVQNAPLDDDEYDYEEL